MRSIMRSPFSLLCAIPIFFALLGFLFKTDAAYRSSGLAVGIHAGAFPGLPTIDANDGVTAFALGKRAALDTINGHLPLWNHHEGLGAPLLGEMQSAALFPPTWLLLLPHGQVLERALLQVLAGLGAYLFFRRFGLGTLAAVAGGCLCELNGVFSWLHNAIFNPVAFLPWLFFAIEELRAGALTERPFARQLCVIALGAVMGALALYAGFPEEVYLYALLLIGWAVFRMAGLGTAHLRFFISGLLATAVMCAALSAPILVAFVDFLPQATVGGHRDNGFFGAHSPPGTFLQYLLPYVFGPIFAAPDSAISSIWSTTGGYIGLTPVILAFAALFTPGYRPAKIFLASWIVIALGASHGWPGIYQAFMTLPLVKIAASFRYLNPSWIFCVIFLATLLLDHAATRPARDVRRIVGGAVVATLIVALLGAVDAWPVMSKFWAGGAWHSTAAIAAVGIAGILGIAILGGARRPRALAAIAVVEMVLWYFVPYLSYPGRGRIDDAAIAFLRAHVGFQRVVSTPEARIRPNFGSALGIPTLDYDDLPVPRATVDYIKNTLDPYAADLYFAIVAGLTAEDEAARRKLFHERLPDYAHAGVKYIVGDGAFNALPAFPLKPGGPYLHPLRVGQAVEISTVWGQESGIAVSAVSLSLGTNRARVTGPLNVRLCAANVCAVGIGDLANAPDRLAFLIVLDRALPLALGAPYTLRIGRGQGPGLLSVWMRPTPGENTDIAITSTDARVPPNFLPDIGFVPSPDLLPVHISPSMHIYELPDTRPYFSAPACRLVSQSWDAVDALCERPSTLTRLEISMRGWSATINGAETTLAVDGPFQAIRLPAGSSHVAFAFAPKGWRPALMAAALALALVLAVAVNAVLNWRGARAAVRTPQPSYGAAFTRVSRPGRAAPVPRALSPIMERKKARADQEAKGDHVIPPERFT